MLVGLAIKQLVQQSPVSDSKLSIPKDTAVTYHGDTARTQAITAENSEVILALQSKDSLIGSLQALVRQYKGQLSSASIIKSTTTISDKGKTTIDSIKTDSLYVYPTYTSNLGNKWYTANIISNSDSTSLVFKTYHEYSLVLGKANNKWYADVKDANPYNAVTNVRVFNVTPPKVIPKRFGLGITTGYGVTPQGLQPFIGAGITYTFIHF